MPHPLEKCSMGVRYVHIYMSVFELCTWCYEVFEAHSTNPDKKKSRSIKNVFGKDLDFYKNILFLDSFIRNVSDDDSEPLYKNI